LHEHDRDGRAIVRVHQLCDGPGMGIINALTVVLGLPGTLLALRELWYLGKRGRSNRVYVVVVAKTSPCRPMAEQLGLTIVYEPGEDGWIVASIPFEDVVRTLKLF
jgi:hypothetical protein